MLNDLEYFLPPSGKSDPFNHGLAYEMGIVVADEYGRKLGRPEVLPKIREFVTGKAPVPWFSDDIALAVLVCVEVNIRVRWERVTYSKKKRGPWTTCLPSTLRAQRQKPLLPVAA